MNYRHTIIYNCKAGKSHRCTICVSGPSVQIPSCTASHEAGSISLYEHSVSPSNHVSCINHTPTLIWQQEFMVSIMLLAVHSPGNRSHSCLLARGMTDCMGKSYKTPFHQCLSVRLELEDFGKCLSGTGVDEVWRALWWGEELPVAASNGREPVDRDETFVALPPEDKEKKTLVSTANCMQLQKYGQ